MTGMAALHRQFERFVGVSFPTDGAPVDGCAP
jgi:hypothetical protein